MSRGRMLVLAALLFCMGDPSGAAPTIEDCYVKSRVPVEKRITQEHSVVLLDETTLFDATQQQHIQQQLLPLVRDGASVEIITFSAFIQGRYSTPRLKLQIAAPLDEPTRRDMRKDDVKDFDVCLIVSRKKAASAMRKVLSEYFGRLSAELAKSDILGVIKEVGDSVVPGITAREKRIVLVSDMLENSDITSFYTKGAPREIRPAEEIGRAKAKGMQTDLRQAKLYVIGAGVVPPKNAANASVTYRSSAVMGALKEFWKQQIEASNGILVAFGQPLLLSPIVGN